MAGLFKRFGKDELKDKGKDKDSHKDAPEGGKVSQRPRVVPYRSGFD
jgi:hypothetical protein